MKNALGILKFVAAFLVVVLLGGLLWWYFFLQGRHGAIAESDAGRGAGTPAPLYGNAAGSSYVNTVSTVSRAPQKFTAGGATARLNTTPTAGFGFLAGSTTVRFVERSSGNVFDADPVRGTLARLTNTLVPRVYEALVSPQGTVIERTYEQGVVATIVGSVQRSATSSLPAGQAGDPGTLRATRLPDDLLAVSTDPQSGDLLYLVAEGSDIAVVRARPDGSKPKTVFLTGISGWRIAWVPGSLTLTQKAADGLDGYALQFKKDGSVAPLMHGPGLTVLTRASSTALAYGYSDGTTLSLYARVDDKASPVALPVRTVANKCVWSPGKQLILFCAVPAGTAPPNFLDRWYRGELHTQDSWWRVDVGAGTATLLYAPSESLDVEDPLIDDSGAYIAFRNARDGSLWVLRTSAQ